MDENNLEKLAIEKTAKTRAPKKRSRAFSAAVAAFAVIAVLALLSWLYLSKGVEVKAAAVSDVYPAQLLSRLNASGYVVAQRKADVAPKITAQLVELLVQEGSMVRKGQVIARLESADAQALLEQNRANLNLAEARLNQAKADLENASVEFDRRKTLVKTGAIARSEYDAAETRYLGAKANVQALDAAVKAAVAAVRSAEVSLEYTEIRAPFDAVVLTKNADVGDILTPLGAAANAKAAVVTIADLSSLQVEADVSESNISQVRVGGPCDIVLDALPGTRFPGEVSTIVPTVDRSKASVLVKVRFLRKDPRVMPEMSAKVGFLSRPPTPDEQKPRLMVSRAAVRHENDSSFVYVIRGDHARKTGIRTGREIGDMVEVLAGLKAGELVVAGEVKGLRDGAKVTLAQQ
jgi:RND family efflux transporter MFP subunit